MPILAEYGLDHLPPATRLALAEALWESVAEEASESPLTPAQEAELERRLADSETRPQTYTPWEVIEERLLRKSRQ